MQCEARNPRKTLAGESPGLIGTTMLTLGAGPTAPFETKLVIEVSSHRKTGCQPTRRFSAENRQIFAQNRPKLSEKRPFPARKASGGIDPGHFDHQERDFSLKIRPFHEKNYPGDDLLSRWGLPISTISAGGLNFRVRNGNGCDPSASVTRVNQTKPCRGQPSRSSN